MQAFRVHSGKAVPLERSHVDTDQIIPKQFLKRIERTGYGEFLFHGWRYLPDGAPNSTFVLNELRFKGGSILLAGKNFGCGSSREHAAWALLDYGFRAVIAPSFADIFAMNCSKNGIVNVVLHEEKVAELIKRAHAKDNYQLTVNLETTEVKDDYGFSERFAIEAVRRKFLLEGLDDIGLTLQQTQSISEYEKRRRPCLSPATA